MSLQGGAVGGMDGAASLLEGRGVCGRAFLATRCLAALPASQPQPVYRRPVPCRSLLPFLRRWWTEAQAVEGGRLQGAPESLRPSTWPSVLLGLGAQLAQLALAAAAIPGTLVGGGVGDGLGGRGGMTLGAGEAPRSPWPCESGVGRMDGKIFRGEDAMPFTCQAWAWAPGVTWAHPLTTLCPTSPPCGQLARAMCGRSPPPQAPTMWAWAALA